MQKTLGIGIDIGINTLEVYQLNTASILPIISVKLRRSFQDTASDIFRE